MMHCSPLLSFSSSLSSSSRDVLSTFLHLLLSNQRMLLSWHQVVLLSLRKQFASVSSGSTTILVDTKKKKIREDFSSQILLHITLSFA